MILISLHLAFAKEAFEITQGLEEDPGDALHLAFFFRNFGVPNSVNLGGMFKKKTTRRPHDARSCEQLSAPENWGRRIGSGKFFLLGVFHPLYFQGRNGCYLYTFREGTLR